MTKLRPVFYSTEGIHRKSLLCLPSRTFTLHVQGRKDEPGFWSDNGRYLELKECTLYPLEWQCTDWSPSTRLQVRSWVTPQLPHETRDARRSLYHRSSWHREKSGVTQIREWLTLFRLLFVCFFLGLFMNSIKVSTEFCSVCTRFDHPSRKIHVLCLCGFRDSVLIWLSCKPNPVTESMKRRNNRGPRNDFET